ncbi:hypothetical protein A6R68_18618 [Neotoma lepida]|uniref:Uncharacterized protein n=1 Tax=Neotoma lepida TaxID=56216 RepID=A0A1A6HKG6_NEOLE|nr:hypothetical protein A6R68_18618 [Neotoma lepida]
MAAPLLPRRCLGYFRSFQCFRVGAAVVFPTVEASASQSSDELEQVRGSSWTSRLGSGVGLKQAARGWVKFATAAVIVSGHQKSSTLSHEMSGLNWKPFVYGGLASIVAEFGTFPVDLTKTRLQVQGQSIDVRFKEIKYRGMFHALFRIYKEEGILALYSGIAPALLRQASYGTIKIGIYQSLKRLFVERLEDETLLINMICGVVSGIRMQAQGSLFQGSMIGSFIDIYQQEGTKGLWRGVVPTAQRAAIVVGVELPVYDITKKHLILSGMLGDTILTHFVSSFTCGLAGALASNPVDVVRTRMMNQRAIVGHVDLYKGTLDGILKGHVVELLPNLPLPIGIDEWVEQGVANSEEPQVLFQHLVEAAVLAGRLHNTSDKKRRPGQSEASNENRHSTDSLEVIDRPWGPVSASHGSCMFHLSDLLAVHRGNLEHVAVEEDKEEHSWEEAGAGEGQHKPWVKHGKEAAGPTVGGLLEYRDSEWEEADKEQTVLSVRKRFCATAQVPSLRVPELPVEVPPRVPPAPI